jgi:myo-inositol-1(or 4)-monophosphatase
LPIAQWGISLHKMHVTKTSLPELLNTVRLCAHEAGKIARDEFRLGGPTTARIWAKAGGSPVTSADVTVDTFLKIRLAELLPEAGWLSEETVDDPARLSQRLVWVVDPIDGTRAFMSGDPDWAVCVALLSEGEPVLGLVYAPAHDKTYSATRGGGARLNGAALQVPATSELSQARVAGPKPMQEALHRLVQVVQMPKVPSLALRIARIAEATLDAALVSPDSRDWDIAASDLILREAGGRLATLEGETPRYNRAAPVHGVLYGAGLPLVEPLGNAMRRWRETAVPTRARG